MSAWPLLLVLGAVPWQAQDAAARAARLESLRALPPGERVVAISEGFLGVPYQLSPLGEGEGRDPDPLERFDRVDCLSMVEQTLAMAFAPSPGDVGVLLQRIRYVDGKVSWASRNHLMEAQWLPNNVRLGVLREVTRELGGAQTVRAQKVLTEVTWDTRSGRALQLEPSERALGTYDFDLLPVDFALERLRQAKPGLLVVMVRKDRPHEVTRITHVGLLVQTSRGPALRHASRTFHKAVDELLEKYLERNLGYGRWTIEGIRVFEPVAPGSP